VPGASSLSATECGELQLIDSGLEKVSIPYSYGFSIILLTLLVKLATFPLTQKQVCSFYPQAMPAQLCSM
jgi:hypothetical protein